MHSNCLTFCFFRQPFLLPNAASSSAFFPTATNAADNSNSNSNAKANSKTNDLEGPRPDHQEINNAQILTTLAKSLWMKDNVEFRLRVLAALAFLIGAKVGA